MNPSGPVKILITDDVDVVVKLLTDQIKKKFGEKIQCFSASGGEQALAFIKENPNTDIIVCDLKMPGVNGIGVLKEALRQNPDSIRILLSGYADLENLANALNECKIFGFINKPWQISQLHVLMDSAIQSVMLHRENKALQEANRQSFDELLSLITDIMAEVSPELFENSRKTAALCSRIAAVMKLPHEQRKTLETAAMLCRLSLIGMPEAIYKTNPKQLPGEQRTMFAKYPELSAEMLKSAPKLSEEREIISIYRENVDGSGPLQLKRNQIRIEARILKIADYYYSAVFLRKEDRQETINFMHRYAGRFFDRECLKAFDRMLSRSTGHLLVPVNIEQLKPGMKLGQDLKSQENAVLLPKGSIITNTNLKRLSIYNALNPVGEAFILIEE